MDLKQRSIQVIKENQTKNGAYVACPNFATYRFCWLRDGSFIAQAMDRVGVHESAELFFQWVNQTLKRHQAKIERLLEKKRVGAEISPAELLPTRFTLDGFEANDDWTNFQLDGYGTWLWAMAEHVSLTGQSALPAEFTESIAATVEYLMAFWDQPNYDCWEENGDKIHTSTLVCICGGLHRINQLLGRPDIEAAVRDIRQFIRQHCIAYQKLTKFAGIAGVDASLLWACVPFQLFDPDDETMKNTVKGIEMQLFHEGGVHRYPGDTYYGGGEWVLLSAWLGWYYVRAGRVAEAEKIMEWIENQADDQGYLAEQVTYHSNNPSYIQPWIERWGPVANPLLWSHAMYLVLLTELKKSIVCLN